MKSIKEFVVNNKVATIVLFILAVLVLDLGISYLSFKDHSSKDALRKSFIGVVVERNEIEIKVEDKPGNIKTFTLSPLTNIKKGRNSITKEELQVGNFVIVNTEEVIIPPIEQPPMEAKRIMVITGRPTTQ